MTDTHTTTTGEEQPSAQEFWDGRYRQSERLFSGRPNAELVAETQDLSPGHALDLGCGEGGDAIWLARQGWRVTATDVSAVALERAARHAEQAGVADRIDFQRHDLAESFPAPAGERDSFDLVSAHFLQSLIALPRDEILRTAAATVAPGGTLLVVDHTGFPSWEPGPHPDVHFPSTQEVLAGMQLNHCQWEVRTERLYEHEVTLADGRVMTRANNILKVRRLSD
ncbi:class I SAM-dependent methyltransferase [Streptomyces sp. TRM66268-LWL]|uniref:Class I SAM-dependent methyltransferase n=1 Tax=Streptomyces polyasparticus TaxID=2767826 RepID=A0ABR7SJF9_9ACTN|nr:class I SAM-dependent methyltransferase [Streptomyces polyasparticus]MBC9715094.1 class I SAM-dependent methyltransferase [Streptomyces polyasparticus]